MHGRPGGSATASIIGNAKRHPLRPRQLRNLGLDECHDEVAFAGAGLIERGLHVLGAGHLLGIYFENDIPRARPRRAASVSAATPVTTMPGCVSVMPYWARLAASSDAKVMPRSAGT